MIWTTLEYLADENIDDAVIEFFKKEGYDFSDVYDENLSAASDRLIIERAKQADKIIITHDTDFGHIIFTDRVQFTGVIYLQPGHIKAQFTIQSLQKFFLPTLN
jgi:predicted nuclease of predicted toxin-antitoxin system